MATPNSNGAQDGNHRRAGSNASMNHSALVGHGDQHIVVAQSEAGTQPAHVQGLFNI